MALHVRKYRVHGYHGSGLTSFHMLPPSKRYKNAVLRDEADQPQEIKYSCYYSYYYVMFYYLGRRFFP